MNIIYAPSPLHGLEILSCSNDHTFTKHLHEGYVLWLNSESDEHFNINGTSDILRLGTVSIIEPGVIHSNSPTVSKQRHLRSFYFSEHFLQKIYTNISGKGKGFHLPTCIIQNRQLWQEFSTLHDFLLHPEDHLSMEVETVSAFSKLYEQAGHWDTLSGISTEKNRINTVIDYFHENLDRQFHLKDVAELVQCTSYHLIRIFQRERNIAPHKFLIQLRLERARIVLEEGTTIADAALSAGFSDQSHLTRMFKARYGVTPGRYQQQRNRLYFLSQQNVSFVQDGRLPPE